MGKQKRPILINNWEGTYFDFTEEKLLQMAEKAHKAGIELFVLDDGWFGRGTTIRAVWAIGKLIMINYRRV